MSLQTALRPECLQAQAALADKDAALRAVTDLAKQCPALASVDGETIYEALKAREELGSTGFGKGIAIPHCRLDSVSEYVVGLLTVPAGVAFDALDGEPVTLIVFIVAPSEDTTMHVKLLSAISHVLEIPGATEEMLAAPSAEALRESFLRHSRDDAEPGDETSKRLFHVFVQDEEKFRDLLRVFAGMENAALLTVPAENAGAYLSKMPLFAGFWSDEADRFAHMIVAVVDASLTNETVRRIERITGRLADCRGVLVTIQDIFYAAGALDA